MGVKKQSKKGAKASKYPEHESLEAIIRELQKSYTNPIPESRFLSHIQRVAGLVAQSLTAADQLMVACRIPSIELVSRMVVLDKDRQAGRIGSKDELDKALKTLGATPLGREGLYRVVHAISSSAIQNLLPLSSSSSLAEIQKAAFIFAAQPLLQALLQEKGFAK
jgi:hypothetical protein